MVTRRNIPYVIALAGVLTAAAALNSCSRRESAAPTPDTAPAPATTPMPATAPVPEDAAVRMLGDLEAQAIQAEKDMDHGRLSRIAEALGRLELGRSEHALRRDALAERLGRQAITLRDALHRFLFVELQDLPPAGRKALLDRADRGDADVVALSAAALAERHFQAARRYLRATPNLPAGTNDPPTQLPVRRAGDLKLLWQVTFNEAFNARMRELVARPATTNPSD
jgi:hypothetical protein